MDFAKAKGARDAQARSELTVADPEVAGNDFVAVIRERRNPRAACWVKRAIRSERSEGGPLVVGNSIQVRIEARVDIEGWSRARGNEGSENQLPQLRVVSAEQVEPVTNVPAAATPFSRQVVRIHREPPAALAVGVVGGLAQDITAAERELRIQPTV